MILFIDIETVSVHASLSEYSEALQQHWKKKVRCLRLTPQQQEDDELAFSGHAGIYAEWSKAVCVGLGYINPNTKTLHLTSITNNDEVELLKQFASIVKEFSKRTNVQFCGHNIKEFDLPFLCRRFVIHNIDLPQSLNLAGLKPWENNHIDTMNLWKFGEFKRFTSLDLLAAVLGVPSPKVNIDGSQVGKVYHQEKNLQKIADYCLLDVETTVRVYYRMQNMGMPFEKIVKNNRG